MGKLNKEQIKTLSDKKFVLGCLKLKCDGYIITLRDGIYKRKIRTELSVNGWLKGEWLIEPDSHPESKFYMPFVRYIKKSPRSKKKEKVDLGMRRPDFASIGQALRYLNKVCDSVEVIEGDDQ
ncbi:hypothetical protein [Psychrobacter sp. JB193]|uniref:hypothetical protein n=1 Tax=Psychrobacter sp. JB193 TaxID=2024406 RepID=UPI000BAAFC91|nr:hypothetical protein [Psychrobacter sp. JB193]PAT63102.1 hypothetical protein CIK80_11160 [Psychrobacter sp. JB193]